MSKKTFAAITEFPIQRVCECCAGLCDPIFILADFPLQHSFQVLAILKTD